VASSEAIFPFRSWQHNRHVRIVGSGSCQDVPGLLAVGGNLSFGGDLKEPYVMRAWRGPERLPDIPERVPVGWLSPNGPPERVIRFPRSRSLGVLYVTYWGRRLPSCHESGWRELGSAKGKVTVPPGNQVWLDVSARGAQDLSPLADLTPGSIQVASFFWTQVRGYQLEPLERLRGLRDLSFFETDTNDDDLALISGYLPDLERLDLSGTAVTDDGLKHVAGLRKLRELALRDTDIDGPGLVHLEALPRLSGLNLGLTMVGDESAEILSRMTGLRELLLFHAEMSDAGVAKIEALKELRTLSLEECGDGITDVSMVAVSRMLRLQHLDLMGTRVTDSGLALLHTLKSLKWIELCSTWVSEEAVEALKKAMPRCRVCSEYGFK